MKKKYLLLFLLGAYFGLNAQSIRKSYTEMTDYEKSELVNAFYTIRASNADLFDDMATFHMNFFNFDNSADPTRFDLHFNLPDEPERDIFLGWHRRQMFEMEQAIQDINPKISLAFWESQIDQSITSPLWDEDFLGSFNTNWSLNRNLGGNGPLPTPADVANLYTISDYQIFSNELERRAVHRGAHVWVGGIMPTPLSPRDPIFYLHHTHVDLIWQNWEKIHQSSSFIRTSMLRYDGTYVFNGETLPSVNPNDLTDSRSLGVFYGVNGLAELDNYTVSNTYNAEEIFYYQYLIEAGTNFIIPSGTTSTIQSVNEVKLTPGFQALSGSNFTASIDQTPIIANKTGKPIVREKQPYKTVNNLQQIVWDEEELKDDTPILIKTYPNPFTDKITVKLSKIKDYRVSVYSMLGVVIRQESHKNTDTIVIDKLYSLADGFYVIRIEDAQGNVIMAKRVIKL